MSATFTPEQIEYFRKSLGNPENNGYLIEKLLFVELIACFNDFEIVKDLCWEQINPETKKIAFISCHPQWTASIKNFTIVEDERVERDISDEAFTQLIKFAKWRVDRSAMEGYSPNPHLTGSLWLILRYGNPINDFLMDWQLHVKRLEKERRAQFNKDAPKRYARVIEMHKSGIPQKDIAAEVGMSLTAVARTIRVDKSFQRRKEEAEKIQAQADLKTQREKEIEPEYIARLNEVWNWYKAETLNRFGIEIDPPNISHGVTVQPHPCESTPIEALGLSVRVYSALKRTGISTVGELVDMMDRGREAMLAIRNFGNRSYTEVVERLSRFIDDYHHS